MSRGNRPASADPDRATAAGARVRRGEAARRRAMEATIDAIAELGGDGVRMADVAARAGMSTGHILYYFGHKDGLLLEALRWSEQDLLERMQAEISRLRAPRRKLAHFAEFYLPQGPSDPRWLLWARIFASPPGDEPKRQMLDSFDQAWEAELGEIARAGIRRGLFRPVNVDEFVVRSRLMMDGLSLDILMGSVRLNRERALLFATRAMERDLGETPGEGRPAEAAGGSGHVRGHRPRARSSALS
jgi:AcrR family transcriptional regulator